MRLVIVALALTLSISPAWAQPSPAYVPSLAAGESLLTVGSQGRHLATPDLVRLAVGATTTGVTSQEAVRLNAELTNRLIAVVRATGIAARDVQTKRLVLEPRFKGDSDQPRRIIDFSASNELVIRIRDIERAPRLLDSLFSAGATNVRGPQFSLQDPTPVRRLAERAAIAEARAKAENLAAALGKRVGRLLSVRSQDYYSEIVVTGSRVSRNAGDTPIEPGEIAVTASIQADFALLDR